MIDVTTRYETTCCDHRVLQENFRDAALKDCACKLYTLDTSFIFIWRLSWPKRRRRQTTATLLLSILLLKQHHRTDHPNLSLLLQKPPTLSQSVATSNTTCFLPYIPPNTLRPDTGVTSLPSTAHGFNSPTKYSQPSPTATSSHLHHVKQTPPSSSTSSKSVNSSTTPPISPCAHRTVPLPQR